MSRHPHVTDHALIRYLERVVGLDLDLHRRAIEARCAMGVKLGASAVVSDGFRYSLSATAVTTVMAVEPSRARPAAWPLRCPDCFAREDELHAPGCSWGVR